MRNSSRIYIFVQFLNIVIRFDIYICTNICMFAIITNNILLHNMSETYQLILIEFIWNGIMGDLVDGLADMAFAPLSVSK